MENKIQIKQKYHNYIIYQLVLEAFFRIVIDARIVSVDAELCGEFWPNPDSPLVEFLDKLIQFLSSVMT